MPPSPIRNLIACRSTSAQLPALASLPSPTRHILNHGSVEQVKEDVKRRLEILAPGGGFVFNTIHNILPDVPPENIVAMYEAVEEFNSAGC